MCNALCGAEAGCKAEPGPASNCDAAHTVRFVETDFREIYQRNNKRGGLKNLRCFPNCAAAHKERGFCGRSVKVDVSGIPADRVLCFAQFLRADQHDDTSAGLNPRVGDTVSLSQLAALERSPNEVTKPLIRGEASSDGAMHEFNRKLKGWHYGWAANKHSCNAEHCFKVYAFERLTAAGDEDKLVCRATCISRSFMLFCRRRRRFQIAPSAPIAKPNQSRRNQRANLTRIKAKAAAAAQAAATATVINADCSSPTASASATSCLDFPIDAPKHLGATAKRKRAAAPSSRCAEPQTQFTWPVDSIEPQSKRACPEHLRSAAPGIGELYFDSSEAESLSTYSSEEDRELLSFDLFDDLEPLPSSSQIPGDDEDELIVPGFDLRDFEFDSLVAA